jgi:hypothetical protein
LLEKRLLKALLGLCAVLSASTLIAQTAAPAKQQGRKTVRQAYETQLPGEWPKGWRRLWGDSSKAVLAVSNMRAVEGNQSLLFHRTDTEQYGIACVLPVENGVAGAELSFCFLIVGAGNNARFSFELRQGKGSQNIFGHIGFGGQAVKLGHISRHRMRAKDLGKYTERRWHKIVVTFPEDEGGELLAELFILSATVPGTWQSIGRQHAETRGSNGNPLFLTLNTPPNKKGYELYIDQLQWRYPGTIPTRKTR